MLLFAVWTLRSYGGIKKKKVLCYVPKWKLHVYNSLSFFFFAFKAINNCLNQVIVSDYCISNLTIGNPVYKIDLFRNIHI